jgi:type VI secretion system secreted protein Hcp
MGETKRKPGLASRIRRPLLAGALAAAAAAPMPAAADVFLKLEGIPGDSQDDKHKGEIDILSYTQSFANTAKIASGTTSGPGKLTCGAVTLLKNIDRSSVEFIRLVLTGGHVTKGVLTFRTPGGTPLEYYTITMEDVVVTSVDQVDNNDPALIIEKVSLLADRFTFEQQGQATGGQTQTTKFGWDCVANRKF